MNIYKPLLVIEEPRNVVSRILMSRRRKMAESFIFFSIKCFAESRRKQKFAAEIFQGEVKSLDRRLQSASPKGRTVAITVPTV